MLLSALSKAREKARGISCASQEKQLGLGMVMYCDDNDDMMPMLDIGMEGRNWEASRVTWRQHVNGYVGDRKMFLCPSDSRGVVFDDASSCVALASGDMDDVHLNIFYGSLTS